MSLNDLLESDLRTLSNEAKKKTGDLKELSEKTISLLRQSDVIPIDSIFQVLVSAKSTNNIKSIQLSLTVLQKLLTNQAIGSISKSLEFLQSILNDTIDETLQLKVLQTLMLMHDPKTVKICPELVNVVWSVYISLQNSKSGLIRNTASATLRQLLGITFHHLTTNRDPDVLQSGVILLTNCCEMVKSRTPDLIKYKTETFGLILEILENTKSYVLQVEQLTQIIDNELLNIILANLNEDVEENIGTKCIKCGLIITEIYSGNQEIIKIITRLCENRKNPEWMVTGCLEFISQALSSPNILRFIFINNELHVKLLDTLSKISHEMFAQTEDLRLPGIKNKVRIISEIISHWVDSIAMITEESGIKLGESNSNISQTLPEALVNSIWKQLLPIFSIMVANSYNESILQTMLNCYQTLVSLSGTLNLSSAREALLASLCQFCIPVTMSVLSHKHMHICKTLFNITHCLGFVLDTKAWHKVLDTLYKLDFLLNNSIRQDDPDASSDINILTSAMESLFKNTHMWPDSTVVDLMSALGQLTLEFMETLATNDKKITGGKVFGIEKMIIVGQNNLERIELYWESLSAYLDCICNSKYSEVRNLGINSISRIVISAFKKFIESPPLSKLEKWLHWQRTLLLSLHDLLGSVYSDTQESVFGVVYSILQSFGGQLDSGGWSMLLFILSKVNINSDNKEGFKCLQLVVSDFLQSENLLPSLERLITCVSKYAHSDDSNHAIGAVGMYWNIADYLGKVGKDEVDLWWIILEELKILGEDNKMEVRHSALHSLHVALSTHGSVLSYPAWQRVMQDIILSLLERISTNYFKNTSKTNPNDPEPPTPDTPKLRKTLYADSNEKQWEETYNIFTQNLGKIFRSYLNNLEKHEKDVLEQKFIQKNWDILIQRLSDGISLGTLNIITAVLKTIKEFLLCPRVTTLFFSKWECSWELFKSLDKRLGTINVNIPYKLINIILEVLGLIFATEFDDPYQDDCLECIYSILASLLKSTTFELALSYAKLLPEQREIWEFIEKIPKSLVKHEKVLNTYIKFLLKYFKYNPEDLHSDSFCRKSMELIEEFIQNYIEKAIDIQNIIDGYTNLLLLRFSNESIQFCINTSKGASPLWYVASESFLKLFIFISQDLYTEKMIILLESVLNPPEKVISKLSKSNLDQILKIGEEIDMKFIENLSSILASSHTVDSKIAGRVIGIIDNGCDSYYKALHATELVLQKSFYSSCFYSLLSLSQESSNCAHVALPVLVNRSKEILVKFSKEEKLTGQMPLPRARLLDILDMLNSIKKLEIPLGILAKPGKKGHLLEVFPQLCELITVKDPEIKESLKQVFLEISKTM